jgi:hypothetical protein
MSRDLLYKPPVPLVLPDEPAEGKKGSGDRPPNRPLNKLGLPQRGRDLGGTKEPGTAADKAPPDPSGAPVAEGTGTAAAGQPADAAFRAPWQKPPRPAAHQAAYFNKDVEATATVNQRASSMQALRGAEGATDLRKITIPAAEMEVPNPELLRAAGGRMMLSGAPDLQALLGQQGASTRAPGMTVERMQARMAQLQTMIAARVAALARMARLPGDRVQRSVTLNHALQSKGEAMQDSQDLTGEGNSLIRGAAGQAEGLHRRMAKTLGIKKSQ